MNSTQVLENISYNYNPNFNIILNDHPKTYGVQLGRFYRGEKRIYYNMGDQSGIALLAINKKEVIGCRPQEDLPKWKKDVKEGIQNIQDFTFLIIHLNRENSPDELVIKAYKKTYELAKRVLDRSYPQVSTTPIQTLNFYSDKRGDLLFSLDSNGNLLINYAQIEGHERENTIINALINGVLPKISFKEFLNIDYMSPLDCISFITKNQSQRGLILDLAKAIYKKKTNNLLKENSILKEIILPTLFFKNLFIRRSCKNDLTRIRRKFMNLLVANLNFKEIVRSNGEAKGVIITEDGVQRHPRDEYHLVADSNFKSGHSKICGSVFYHVKHKLSKTIGEVSALEVHKKFQGKKIGGLLLIAALIDMHIKGCNKVSLLSTSQGLSLYVKAGFIPKNVLSNKKEEEWRTKTIEKQISESLEQNAYENYKNKLKFIFDEFNTQKLYKIFDEYLNADTEVGTKKYELQVNRWLFCDEEDEEEEIPEINSSPSQQISFNILIKEIPEDPILSMLLKNVPEEPPFNLLEEYPLELLPEEAFPNLSPDEVPLDLPEEVMSLSEEESLNMVIDEAPLFFPNYPTLPLTELFHNFSNDENMNID